MTTKEQKEREELALPNPEPSKTPRTDKEAYLGVGPRSVANGNAVTANFARQLETELAAANLQILYDTECIERCQKAGAEAEVKLAAVTKERDEANRARAFISIEARKTDTERDQLRQRVEELESGFLQLAQAVIDAHRKPGVGPAVPYKIAVRVLELLSTNQTEGGEPACPSLDPVIQETETYYIWKDTSSLPVEKLKYTIANLQNALNEAKRKLNEAVPIEIEEIIKQRDDAEYRATNLQNALNSANAQARVWETTANSYAETMRNIAKEVFGDAGLSNKAEFSQMVKEKFKQAENRLQIDSLREAIDAARKESKE